MNSYVLFFSLFETLRAWAILTFWRVHVYPFFFSQAGVFAPLVLFTLFFGTYLFGMASFLAHASLAWHLLFIAHTLLITSREKFLTQSFILMDKRVRES